MKRFLFHNFRIVYNLDRWMRQRFTGAFGIDTRQNFAYQLFSLLLILLLLAFLSNLRFRLQAKVQRELPPFATVGET